MNRIKPILRTENINKYFVDPVKVQVLKQVNIEVNKGEFVSIMGKSGCGKSTLLYILSTMDTAYEGNLFLGDRLLTGLNGAALSEVRNQHIGFVFQFHYLLPEFTVLQNVMMPGLKLARKSKDEVEHDAMKKLALLGVDDQALKKATQISGGQKQRVAIARALINEIGRAHV